MATHESNSRNQTWHWTNNKTVVAAKSWLWVWLEPMAWQLIRLELLNGIQWSWIQIPFRSTFYSYFKESFSGKYHMYHSFRYTHMITSSKCQWKQTCRMMKAIAEMKLDTEPTMKLGSCTKLGQIPLRPTLLIYIYICK